MSSVDSSHQILNFKTIHIGSLIKQRVSECKIESNRICKFIKCSEAELQQMFQQQTLDSEVLLRWSKLLSYDFFRIYSQHLIFYSPPGNIVESNVSQSKLPTFRKNIYTQEIKDFILEQLNSGEMTRNQVIEHYRIPKTTLYKWIDKHQSKSDDETKL